MTEILTVPDYAPRMIESADQRFKSVTGRSFTEAERKFVGEAARLDALDIAEEGYVPVTASNMTAKAIAVLIKIQRLVPDRKLADENEYADFLEKAANDMFPFFRGTTH